MRPNSKIEQNQALTSMQLEEEGADKRVFAGQSGDDIGQAKRNSK